MPTPSHKHRHHLPQKHPVSALLLRTNHIDFGLEKRATAGLFNESTLLDRTFGFGAVGALQFVGYQLQFASSENDFEADIKNRGLQHLPIRKYASYGKLYRDAFEKPVGAYLEAHYPSDKAAADDKRQRN